MIQTHNLTVGYHNPILSDLSLNFPKGQLHALLGPNGCGKTTLFKTLMGLLPRQGGQITLNGQPLETLSITERAREIAYVPQIHNHVFPYSVIEMVLMGRTAHIGMFSAPSQEDREHAIEALSTFGITHLAQQEFTKLSGGQRQLVTMARAIAQGASILVLDEPTASLDFGNEIRVLEEVGKMARRGWTVILSTHNPSHALQLADQVIVLNEGKVFAQGQSDQIITESNLSELYKTPIGIGQVHTTPICAPLRTT